MMRYGSVLRNEVSSKALLKLAARVVRDPQSATPEEVQKLAASVLTQAPDKPPRIQTK